jgi:DNA end-binding protein Ku
LRPFARRAGIRLAPQAAMARAMWKAALRFGRHDVPVKLYAAVEDRGVHFRLLHAKDHVPVAQRMVDPASGDEVDPDQVRRGLEVEKGVFVWIREEEHDAVQPPAGRAIEVTRFVPRDAVDPAWYRRPYWLGPNESDADYFALVRALEQTDRCGVAAWTLRKKRYVGALTPSRGYLALVALAPAAEVVTGERLAKPDGPPIRKEERQLAEQLLAALDAPFDPAALRDPHRERVRALVEAKAEGRTLEAEPEPSLSAPKDLQRALRASLAAAKERRVA